MSFRHVTGVIGNSSVTMRLRVLPDLVTARGLPVKNKTKLLQALDDFTILEAREPPHQAFTING